MASREVLNLYCDESCHLENDRQPVMGLGAISCPAKRSFQYNHELRDLKRFHEMPESFELKWTKVGKSKIGYYKALIDFFVESIDICFRGYVIDKSTIDHGKVPGQTHDQWYYKMYYGMLKPFVENQNYEHRVYIDIKDTHGYQKTQELKRILQRGIGDYNSAVLTRVQEVRSDEVELLQLADFILGLIVYANRDQQLSPVKRELVSYFQDKTGVDVTRSTRYSARKVNLWMWNGSVR